MFAKLSALVGGGPALNYTVDPEPYEVAWGCWTHHSGTSREDGSPVSVFRIAATDPNDLKLAAARNGVKRLKLVSSDLTACSKARKTPAQIQSTTTSGPVTANAVCVSNSLLAVVTLIHMSR